MFLATKSLFSKSVISAGKLALLVLAAITINASALSINVTEAGGSVQLYDPGFDVSASQEPAIVIGPNGATIGTSVSWTGGIGDTPYRGTLEIFYSGRFTVDEDVAYSISGILSGFNESRNSFSQTARLIDITPGSAGMVFRFRQGSAGIGDFTAPLVEGSVGSEEFSPTGTLKAGHTYDWWFVNELYFGSAFSATGEITLTIGDGGGASVPDGGATLALLSVGLGGIGLLRRKLSI